MKPFKIGLTILIFLSTNSLFSQEKNALILKTSPLSLLDLYGGNISLGLESRPKLSSYSTEIGAAILLSDIGDNWRIQNRNGFILKGEFRSFFKNKSSIEKPSYGGFYVANEIAIRLEKYDKYDSYRLENNDPEETGTFRDFEVINRQEIRNTIKLGFQPKFAQTITFDTFIGLGINYHFTQISQEVDAEECCPTLRIFEQPTNTGFGWNPFIGLKLGYILRK